MLTEGNGVPLSLIVTGANRHDSAVLEALLDDRFVPELPDETLQQNLCLDAGYTGKQDIVTSHNYEPHIRPRGEEKKDLQNNPDFRARRWVVESCHSWFKRFRKLCPRYEKTLRSFKALLSLAAGLITLNKVVAIYG